MIFDAHFHIIDPNYPLVANKGYLPEAFTADDYCQTTKALALCGGCVVSGSFQQFDQTYLLAALKKLGCGFVGVTQLPANVSDAEIMQLHEHGVRAVRFNLFRGGSETSSVLQAMAKRIFDLAGWHIELYVDSKDLAELSPLLLTLPKVSIDHLGLSEAGFIDLCALVEKGVYVKATGFMRVDFDVLPALQTLYELNSDALLFGTDLPGTRASRQFSQDDVQLITKNFTSEATEKILWKNAVHFYGLYPT